MASFFLLGTIVCDGPEQHTDTICTNMGLVVISWEWATCKHLHTGWGSAVCTGALRSFKQLKCARENKNWKQTPTQHKGRSQLCVNEIKSCIHLPNDSRLQQEFYRLLTLFIDVALRSGICPPSVSFPPYVLCGFKSSNQTSSLVSASFSYSDIWS